MGDGGSYLLGSSIAISFLMISTNSINQINQSLQTGGAIRLFEYSLVFILPFIDMISVILYRIKNKTSIFYPDRSHFHYRIADRGCSHKKTVYVIYEIFVVTAGISYFDFNLLISMALLLLVNPILLCLIFLEKEN